MKRFGIRIKGIVKHEDKFLIVKKWYDDRITEPYQWEFFDTELEYGSSPDNFVIQMVSSGTGLDPVIDCIPYTWSYEIGEMQVVGIAYLCHVDSEVVILSEDFNDYAWVTAEELGNYIENRGILRDIRNAGII